MADSKRSLSPRAERGMSLPRRAFLLVLLAGWAFVAASLIGFDPADPPTHLVWPANDPVVNWCGPFGATVSYTLFKLLGIGAWALVLFMGLGLLSAATGQLVRHGLVRILGLLMLAVSFSGLQNLLAPDSGSMPDLAGGLIGSVGVAEITTRFGGLGAGIILFVMALIGAVVAMDEWLLAAFGWMWRNTREHGVPAAKVAGAVAGETALNVSVGAAKVTARAGGGLWSALIASLRPGKPRIRPNDIDDDVPAARARKRAGPKPVIRLVETRAEPNAEVDIPDPDVGSPTAQVEAKPARGATPPPAVAEEEEDDLPGAPQVFDQEALKAKIAKLPVVFGTKNRTIATAEDLRDLQIIDEGENYRFPGLDLLEEPEENFSLKLEEYVRTQAEALEAALKQYRIDGEVVGIESGPVITMYEVRLAPGTKVAQVNAVASDLARSLKAINIRIVSNMAGRDTVGVEVPNEVKEKVRLKELMSKSDRFSKMKLPTFLGKDAAGEPLIEDLTKMPHMLIAGTTGSGKSVCMNTIIMGFLYTKKPSELKMVLVDPKMVEMSQFKDIPHLMCPVVTEMGKAAAILEWACGKMDERYELLAEAGCQNIAVYNELGWDELKERLHPGTPEEEARIPRKLPYMVFIIDELADLMMTNKEVEGSIIRIAQKARAVGIHLILATQRPQANVVTGLIKSNMPCRISFKVASGMDSRIVLDQKGGELLLGQGDMLVLSPTSHKLMRAQGTLVDDREIRRVVKFMREVAAPSFERQLVQLKSHNADEERLEDSVNNSSASLEAAQEDPLFNRSVEIVLESKRGSVSLLQRRLAIGYTRASRLIDLMGFAGILGEHKGSVAREVQISVEEWAAMKALAAEQAKALGLPLPGEGVQTSLFPNQESATEEAPFETQSDAAAEAPETGDEGNGQEDDDQSEPEDEVDSDEDSTDDEGGGEPTDEQDGDQEGSDTASPSWPERRSA